MKKLLIVMLVFGSFSTFAKKITYKCTQKNKEDTTIVVKTSLWSGKVKTINNINVKDFRDPEPISEHFDLTNKGAFKRIASSKIRKDVLKQQFSIFDYNDTAAYDIRFLTLEKEAYFLNIDRPSDWCFLTYCHDNYRTLRKCVRK
jgi:hypothetical protein